MGKLKTKKGVAKRFRLTKSGKLKYALSGKSHLGTGKEPERLRRLRRRAVLEGKKKKKFIKSMLPYG